MPHEHERVVPYDPASAERAAYWLAADAPPIGAAVPLLIAAGPPVPAVPAVSFEPERLHPRLPPASAAINTAVITFLSTGSIIISSSVDVTRS